MRTPSRGALACTMVGLCGMAATLAAEQASPPWEASPVGEVNFTVPGVNNVPDLHGDIIDPDLVIFFGGNQFMVMPEIIDAFRKAFPRYQRIFYETLPPGIIEKQVREGSLIVGNLRVTLRPEVYRGEKQHRGTRGRGVV